MSRKRATRRAAGGRADRRAGPRGRQAGAGTPSDGIGRIVRWVLGLVLAVVLVLFGASVLGLLDSGRQTEAVPALTANARWDEPIYPAANGAGSGPSRSAGDGGVANRVLTWATDALGTEPQGSREPISGDSRPPAPGNQEPQRQPTRIYLANGCGAARLAATLREMLPRGTFDVCGVSNADRSDYSETLVIDRRGDPARAQEVCAFFQRYWGVGRVVQQVRRSPETDVLVVLGQDLADCLKRDPSIRP